MPTEAHVLGGRTTCHPDGEEGNHETREICQQVSSIGSNGQTVGEQTTDRFAHHEEETQHRSYDQSLASLFIHTSTFFVREMAMRQIELCGTGILSVLVGSHLATQLGLFAVNAVHYRVGSLQQVDAIEVRISSCCVRARWPGWSGQMN